MFIKTPEGWNQAEPLGSYVENSPVKWDGSTPFPYVGMKHIESATGRLIGCGDSLQVKSAKNKFEQDDVLFGKLSPNLRKFWSNPSVMG